jgi:hypothetical protein
MYHTKRGVAHDCLPFFSFWIYLLILISTQGVVRAEWPQDSSTSLPICRADASQYDPRLIKVTDGYVLIWQDGRNGKKDIYAQKFDVNGNLRWTNNGKVVAAGNSGEASNHLVYNSQSISGIVSDSQGGAIVLWTEDYSCSSGPCGNAWITRIDSTSDVKFGMAPSPAVVIQGTDTAVLLNPHAHAESIASDGEGGAFVIFSVDPWGRWYVFRLDGNGLLRSVTPDVVGARSGARLVYGGNSNGKDRANIAWWDYGDYATTVIDPEVNYPASTDTLSAAWSKLTLTSSPAWWSQPSVISDGTGGMIVAWEDSRNGNSDLFAQKIGSDGNVHWTATGVPIVVEQGTQRFQQLVSDGAGGAIVVWEDWRASPTRVYGQHIRADGTTIWAENGVAISSTYGEAPKIVRSEDGSSIIVWHDSDHDGWTKDYLRAQKVGPTGFLIWPVDSRTELGETTGVVISEMYGEDYDIASDDARGLIAVWTLGGDIYAKRIAPVIPENPMDTVQRVYVGYYQRPADPGGLLWWAGKLREVNGNLNEIIDAYANSPESRDLYGTINNSTIGDVIDGIYTALFNRKADAAGKAYYIAAYTAGQFPDGRKCTEGTIVLDILGGAQREDLISINNKLAVANLFTRTIDPELDGFNFQVTYAGEGDAIKARTFLRSVTDSAVTLLSQNEMTAWMKDNIADQGDPILNH